MPIIKKAALGFIPFILVFCVVALAFANKTPVTLNLFGYSVDTELTWLVVLSCLVGFASGIITAKLIERMQPMSPQQSEGRGETQRSGRATAPRGI